MRAAFKLSLAIACTLACHHAHGPAAPVDGGTVDGGGNDGAGAYLLYERFDEFATGAPPAGPWTTSGAVAVREVPFAVDKSAEIAKPTGAGTASLGTTFPDQHGRIVVEAKVLARETAGFKAIPYIYDASGNTVASVSFQDGNIQAHVGATTTTVQPFVANTFYRVRVVVDTDAQVFDLYVDGIGVAIAQALRTPSDSVDRLSYYVDGDGAGTLVVDNVKVYVESSFIGAPPQPIFDARTYGATGDGTTNDGAALQAAIDAAAGSGGSVVLYGGTFLAGTLALRSNMTLFVDSSATLRGSTDPADYPTQSPPTGNTQLSNTQRALLYAQQTSGLVIDGGGTIDGQGDAFSGVEATRPLLLWAVLSDHVTVRNVNFMKGAVWGVVSMESDQVTIHNVNVQSNDLTHDGIDIVDGADITIDDVAVKSGDDAMCLKSGVRRGIVGMVVKDSIFGGTSAGSNGIKLGTATYGAFSNITIRDSYVKDVQYAAMAVESREGADISGVSFQRVQFANTGDAFFVYLAQQSTTHPIGDVPKLGSIDRVSFADILGSTASYAHSPHQGSLITGNIFNDTTYAITNLAFANVVVTFTGGLATVPANPPEATPNEYPESNMFGDLPAWGYYLRHVSGATFTNCMSNAASADARQVLVTDDTSALVGGP
jgi:hypothetical protein